MGTRYIGLGTLKSTLCLYGTPEEQWHQIAGSELVIKQSGLYAFAVKG